VNTLNIDLTVILIVFRNYNFAIPLPLFDSLPSYFPVLSDLEGWGGGAGIANINKENVRTIMAIQLRKLEYLIQMY